MSQAGPQRRKIAVLADRLYLSLRHRDAWHPAVADPTTGKQDFSSLRGQKYCLLSTFRKNGESVPTPVWFGLADGKVYIRTEAGVGKVKRIRREPRVQIAPCTFRGRPLGPSVEGHARILAPAESQDAERAIAANYGLERRLYEDTISRLLYSELLYIEVAPLAGVSGDVDERPDIDERPGTSSPAGRTP